MNRRLHAMPFRTTQGFIAYKAAFEDVPIASVKAEYTSQSCALTACEHAEEANRKRRRFNCKACGYQDHADRNAFARLYLAGSQKPQLLATAVNVAKRRLAKCELDMPTLERFPCVRKVRRWASGRVHRSTSFLVTA